MITWGDIKRRLDAVVPDDATPVGEMCYLFGYRFEVVTHRKTDADWEALGPMRRAGDPARTTFEVVRR